MTSSSSSSSSTTQHQMEKKQGEFEGWWYCKIHLPATMVSSSVLFLHRQDWFYWFLSPGCVFNVVGGGVTECMEETRWEDLFIVVVFGLRFCGKVPLSQ